MNELLAQLRAAADNLHAALVVWENHIDHPGARTAIHSAARVLLDAASAMPTHYDDGSEKIRQLERHIRVLEISTITKWCTCDGYQPPASKTKEQTDE